MQDQPQIISKIKSKIENVSRLPSTDKLTPLDKKSPTIRESGLMCSINPEQTKELIAIIKEIEERHERELEKQNQTIKMIQDQQAEIMKVLTELLQEDQIAETGAND